MKYLLLISTVLVLSSCTASKKATQTNTASTGNNTAQLHIRNDSKFIITKISIDKGDEEAIVYDEIKPGKTSAYKTVKKLCNCGYKIDIWYKQGTETFSIVKDCVNIMPCTDYFEGKVLMNLKCEDPSQMQVELNFEKEK